MTGTMTCREGVRILMDYTEGLLPRGRIKVVEAHVAGCARCRGFVRSYLETPRILREATLTRMPPGIGRRLRRRVAALASRGGGHAGR
jgi:anti-sigma factor RsiW